MSRLSVNQTHLSPSLPPSASSSQRPYVPCAPIWNSSSSEQPSRHRTVVPTAMPSLLPQILPILQWMGDGGCVRGLQTQPPALLGGNKGRELRIEGSVRASQDWKPPTFPIWEQRQCYRALRCPNASALTSQSLADHGPGDLFLCWGRTQQLHHLLFQDLNIS